NGYKPSRVSLVTSSEKFIHTVNQQRLIKVLWALLIHGMKIDKLEIPKMFGRACFILWRVSRSYHKSATPNCLSIYSISSLY
ncbi:hypothetical protein, partial [Microcoleus sp. MON2_D5]|uniref:hypothetical protein n=1 Tax=Microcoleus sp. MON2_D5 TaxID=2818833 RepID=UPI002FD737D8